MAKWSDGDVIGIERATGHLIQWNARSRQKYTSGETLKEFGARNLTAKERQRLKEQTENKR